MDSLKISCVNINSLLRRQDEVDHFVHSNDLDILCITETHLAQGLRYAGKPRNYTFFRSDHPSNNCRGGAGILVKNSLRYQHDPRLNVSNNNFQSVGVTVTCKFGDVYIAAVYCPPGKETHISVDEFNEFFQSLPQRHILAGDWNSKHVSFGCRKNNPRGRELKASLEKEGAFVATDGFPTYYPTAADKQPDLLDFFIVKNISRNYLNVGSEIELSSDHIPIHINLFQSVILKTSNSVINSRTDWIVFRDFLNNNLHRSEINSVEVLEYEAEHISKIIITAAGVATPVIRAPLNSISLPRELRDLVKVRRRLRAKWIHSRHFRDRINFNRVSRLVTSEISKLRQTRLQAFLRNLTPTKETNYSLYKVTKYLKRPPSYSQPLQTPLGTWTRSNQQKADEFLRHLSEVFKPHPDIVSDLDVNLETLQTPLSPDEEISKIKTWEVEDTIRYKFKLRKAPGIDLVIIEMLRNLPKLALRKLADIYNAVIALKHVPSAWKTAEVVMFPKKGKQLHLASSYRPISLLSVVGKLFEKLFLKRLEHIVDERKIIPGYQFGFRRKHSTVEQIHRLTDHVEKCLENKLVCSVAFLDVAQAFDRVWLDNLSLKLRRLLPGNYYLILESYLKDRFFRVRYEGCISKTAPISSGVQQGSILAPLLFIIYIYDFPYLRGTRLSNFADDTAHAAIGRSHSEANQNLQLTLNLTTKYCKNSRTKLNSDKSQHCIFANIKPDTKELSVKLGKDKIPSGNSANYLGMILDRHLTYGTHVEKKRRQVLSKYRSMYWLFRPGGGMSLLNKLTLYKSILLPCWSYGAQIWGCASPTHISKIQKLQNRVLRGITGVRWDDYVRTDDIHHILGVPTVSQIIDKLTLAYAKRLDTHPNPRAYHLLDSYEGSLRRLQRAKPFDRVADQLDDLL